MRCPSYVLSVACIVQRSIAVLRASSAVALSRRRLLAQTHTHYKYARVQRDYGIRGRSFLRTTANTTWFVF